MRRPLLFAFLAILVAIPPQFLSAADPLPIPPNAPTGAELITKIRADVQWLAEVDSLHIDATAISIDSKEKIASSLHELKRMYPDRMEFPPQEFTELLPVIESTLRLDYDRKRFRLSVDDSRSDGNRFYRSVESWDGNRSLQHTTRSGINCLEHFSIRPSTKYPRGIPLSHFSFTHQPISFWWNSSELENSNIAQYGDPEDYILVGRENFHEVDCHVLLRTGDGNYRDRYYVGVDDHRWYGFKSGVSSLAHAPNLSVAYAQTVSDFLGFELNSSSGPLAWDRARSELDNLKGARLADWAKMFYQRVARHYDPVFECWFADYQSYGPGRIFPSLDTRISYKAEGTSPPFVATTRTLKINKITIDQPLDDKLFEDSPGIGAHVTDWTHDPPLFYDHKESFTQEDWEEILETGREWKQNQQKNSRKGLRKYGKPVRELPQATWLNSKPLSWKDLRGKVVVLHFFSIDEPDSLTDIDSLRAPLEKEEDLLERAAKQGLRFPIVTIGIHAPDTPLEKIRKVIDERKLQSPVVQDEATKDIIGKFAEACGVTSYPTSIAFDEAGNLLAIGSMKEILDLVKNYTQPPDK